MARPEKEVKPNKGQDEVLHTIQMPDGSDVRQVTQREWRETYRDLGYIREPDEDEGTETAETVAE